VSGSITVCSSAATLTVTVAMRPPAGAVIGCWLRLSGSPGASARRRCRYQLSASGFGQPPPLQVTSTVAAVPACWLPPLALPWSAEICGHVDSANGGGGGLGHGGASAVGHVTPPPGLKPAASAGAGKQLVPERIAKAQLALAEHRSQQLCSVVLVQ